MLIFLSHIIISFIVLSGCGTATESTIQKHDNKSIDAIGYDLNNPDETFFLPAVLHEISGITVFDSSSIACVQDENGIIFIYDLIRKAILRHITFSGNGDYEGIAKPDGVFYVLKSNGTLYKISDLNRPLPAEEIRLKEIPHKDIEGLCYDSNNERLLIAPKDRADKDVDAEVRQGLYSFDPKTGELMKDPLIEFKLPAIKESAVNLLEPVENNKKGEPKKHDIRFSPSAIAIHPITGRLYLLSADDHMLFIFNLEEKIEYITRLNPEIFNMAEGIAFFQNGDMLISNEGQNRSSTLLRFEYRKK
ncbi:MAG: hypothetical protein V1903_07315 [Bacteroidota bacterium]